MKKRTQKAIQKVMKHLNDAESILEKETNTLRSDYRGHYQILIDNLLSLKTEIIEIQNEYFFLNEK